MPTDHLTLSADQIADQVEAILGGGCVGEYAELADAVETYRTAGRAALEQSQDRVWFNARIRPRDWASVEPTFATHISPRLDQFAGFGWWFLRKHPDWRVRVRTDKHSAVRSVLDQLVRNGIIAGWQESIYEPEIGAFGGGYAMNIVHDLFCADSRGVLNYAQQVTPGMGRRELSLLLIRALQQHAGLDPFEAGDVFDRVTRMRPPLDDANRARINALATRMQSTLSIPIRADNPLFATDGPLFYAAPWLNAHIDAGRQLRRGAANKYLERGLRAILAQVLIFHWNRLGLSAATQSVLAHAAKAALLPGEAVR